MLEGSATVKPAKGAIPRAKQLLAASLKLPTQHYAHAIRLSPGNFSDLRVI